VSPISCYILCLETANAVTSVAISKDGQCIALGEVLEPNRAADKLHVLTEALLTEAGLSFADLNAVAISAGPGSYTGLRIAAAAAKGYCFSLDIPLIAIPTLQAMVEGVQTRYAQMEADVYVPMIDARRMEVFTSFYTNNKEIVRSFPSLVLDPTFEEMLQPELKYLLFGNGAIKAVNLLTGKDVSIINDFVPSAQDLCAEAWTKFKDGSFEDLAYYEPHYSKAFHSTMTDNHK